MALSMDEQRMLAEIERRLAAEDPGLAIRLSSFRRPSPSGGLRTRKGRLVMFACMIALIAVVSAVIYVLVPFRPQQLKAPSTPQSPHQTSAYSSQADAGTGN
jgi:hypothetical protein